MATELGFQAPLIPSSSPGEIRDTLMTPGTSKLVTRARSITAELSMTRNANERKEDTQSIRPNGAAHAVAEFRGCGSGALSSL
jgi:hypothetical protein